MVKLKLLILSCQPAYIDLVSSYFKLLLTVYMCVEYEPVYMCVEYEPECRSAKEYERVHESAMTRTWRFSMILLQFILGEYTGIYCRSTS